jgi:hypothetical protein
VIPVENHSGQSGIGNTLWQQLIREINDCPRFATGSETDAEFILHVVIDDFSKSIGTTSPKNSDAIQAYALTSTARCTLTEKETGDEVLNQQIVRATVTVPTHPSFAESKRQADVQICSIFAKKICDLLSCAMDFSLPDHDVGTK